MHEGYPKKMRWFKLKEEGIRKEFKVRVLNEMSIVGRKVQTGGSIMRM